MSEQKLKFSVVMSVYKNDNPDYVQVALSSIINQTLVPDEIVLIADGPIPDSLRTVIERTQSVFPALHPYYQEKMPDSARLCGLLWRRHSMVILRVWTAMISRYQTVLRNR